MAWFRRVFGVLATSWRALRLRWGLVCFTAMACLEHREREACAAAAAHERPSWQEGRELRHFCLTGAARGHHEPFFAGRRFFDTD